MSIPRTAFITGASQGLGRALALRLAENGFSLALVARSRPELLAATEAARAAGAPRVLALVGDVGRKEDIHALVGLALAELGSVGVLINNASTLGPTPLPLLSDTECEDFSAVLEVNLLGPFRLTRALLPAMTLRGSGLVINISSDAASSAYPRWGAYGSSKAALAQLTAIWGAELEGTGVRLRSVDPGEMNTRMHRAAIPDADPATLADPGEVARRILREVELC